ncbi:MAG: protein translocase subunit SecA [marine bacterium B5-7]|nr:MAG: protein translocase subunit SecA [marine bacterium B5-7]
MFKFIAKKIVGSRNERILKKYGRIVQTINSLEPELQAMSDEQLQTKTAEFKQRIADGESLDNILPEAFALVREAGMRTLRMRHFDVQLVGGMVLHYGKIAEMRTGEGKTLTATLPVYLNALSGDSVHLVTVNDYLAERDAHWMRPLYEFLGLSVGVIKPMMGFDGKRDAYLCDVVFGTNNEFGFDYLRDNMALESAGQVQRKLAFAIVDEVDSILIDEARTPLVISGESEQSSDLYQKINAIVPQLKKAADEKSAGDFYLDEKTKQAFLTEAGYEHVEALLEKAGLLAEGESLFAARQIALNAHLNAGIRAHALFQRDVDYLVRNDEVMIVDEHTGRTMDGRRWSDGLHQAIEAKEGVPIQSESHTLASITYQNYFRLYHKLAGMTGTADTEAFEFHQIYGLEVVVLPTNKPMLRIDHGDQVFLTRDEKYNAVIAAIKAAHEKQQPTLVGTASIESSEYLSDLLKKENITHNVLNAKFHEQEAQIIVEAGRPGAVTIATNMAGRGTDIVLGGNLNAEIAALGREITDEKIAELTATWKQNHKLVLESGGLFIIGSERHESRRIDNQLRGRSGRQGDPGASRFYLSLDDDLMRIFAADRMSGMMKKLGMGEGEPIEHPWVTRVIENAQRKVEGHNFDMRKQLLDYDDVANDQRKVVYTQRNELLQSEDIGEYITSIREDVVHQIIDLHIPPESMEDQWDPEGLTETLLRKLGISFDVNAALGTDEGMHEEALREQIYAAVVTLYQAKEAEWTAEVARHLEKAVMLQVLDHHWKEHLAEMDYLRMGIGLRGYAQKDPKQEYKREAFELFAEMLERIKVEVISTLQGLQLQTQEEVEAMEAQQRQLAEAQALVYEGAGPVAEPIALGSASAQGQSTSYQQETTKIGRNDPCHCGSGKKFKQCHGKL